MNHNLFDDYYQAILNDIFLIEESYSSLFMISDHARRINSLNLGHVFFRLQEYFSDAMMLAIGRLFDRRSDVFSIPNMVAASDQFDLVNLAGFSVTLRRLNADDNLIGLVEKEGPSDQAIQKIKLLIPKKETLPQLQRVLNRRHKEVAHRDNSAKNYDRPLFSDVKFCNELAKEWIDCFAAGFKGVWASHEPFLAAAQGTAVEIKWLFKLLKVLEPEDGSEKLRIRWFDEQVQRLKTE